MDAVFSPSPNLPRSSWLRFEAGSCDPNLIAAINRSSGIPQPLSITATHGSALFQENLTRISVASAVRLLSIRSAIAVSRVYPMLLSDSIKHPGSGGRSVSPDGDAETRLLGIGRKSHASTNNRLNLKPHMQRSQYDCNNEALLEADETVHWSTRWNFRTVI